MQERRQASKWPVYTINKRCAGGEFTKVIETNANLRLNVSNTFISSHVFLWEQSFEVKSVSEEAIADMCHAAYFVVTGGVTTFLRKAFHCGTFKTPQNAAQYSANGMSSAFEFVPITEVFRLDCRLLDADCRRSVCAPLRLLEVDPL